MAEGNGKAGVLADYNRQVDSREAQAAEGQRHFRAGIREIARRKGHAPSGRRPNVTTNQKYTGDYGTVTQQGHEDHSRSMTTRPNLAPGETGMGVGQYATVPGAVGIHGGLHQAPPTGDVTPEQARAYRIQAHGQSTLIRGSVKEGTTGHEKSPAYKAYDAALATAAESIVTGATELPADPQARAAAIKAHIADLLRTGRAGEGLRSILRNMTQTVGADTEAAIDAIAAAASKDLAKSDKFKQLEDAAEQKAERELSKIKGFRVVDNAGDWNNKGVFQEQVWMLKSWFPGHLKKNQKAYTTGSPAELHIQADLFGGGQLKGQSPVGENPQVRYCYAKTDKDSHNYLANLLAVKHSYLYTQIPPSVHAILIPKIKITIEYPNQTGNKKGSENVKELLFDEHLTPEDLRSLMSGKQGRIPGVGLVSISLEDKSSSAAELKRNYVFTLKVKAQSIKDFGKTDSPRATFHDLWYNVQQANAGGPTSILRVDLGWQVPTPRAIQSAWGSGCTLERAKEFIAAIEFNNLSFRLSLSKYALNFEQDGSVEYSGTYIAANTSPVFARDAFPVPADDIITIANPDPTGGADATIKFKTSDIRQQVTDLEARVKSLQEKVMKKMKRMADVAADPKNEKLKKIQDDVKKLQSRQQMLESQIHSAKDQVKKARFSQLVKNLMKDEMIQTISVIESEGKLTTQQTISFDMKKVKGAVKASKNLLKGSTDAATRKISAITLQTAVKGGANGHLIPFVRFGQIIETLVKIMVDDTEQYYKSLKNVLGTAIGGWAGSMMSNLITPRYRDFQIHLGPAWIRYAENQVYCANVGELPITMNRLSQFMQRVYSRMPWDNAPVPFSEVFEMACQTLLGEVLSSHDFFATTSDTTDSNNTKSKNYAGRHIPRIKKFTAKHSFMSKYAKSSIVLGGSSLQGGATLSIDEESFGGYSNAIRNLKNDERAMDVYFLYIQEYAPVKLPGTMAANTKHGIHHFYIGADKGLLRTITFSEDNVEGRQEAIMLGGASSGKERQIFKFDAQLKLVGNSMFSNSDLIYIDPSFAGLGSASKKSLLDTGLGGYYYVSKVNHMLSRDGFETELTAKWDSHGSKGVDNTKFANYFSVGAS